VARAGGRAGGDVHGSGGRVGRQRRAARRPEGPRGGRGGRAVDGVRLRPRLRAAADHRRAARGHRGAPPRLPVRRRGVHGRVGAGGRGSRRGRAGRGAGRAGRVRGADGAAGARVDHRAVPARTGPDARLHPLRRPARRRADGRAAARRAARRPRRVAADLPDQPAGGRGRLHRRRAVDGRLPGPSGAPAGPGGRRAGRGGVGAGDVPADRGPGARLAVVVRRAAPGRRRPRRRVRPAPAARGGPAGAARAAAAPLVRGRAGADARPVHRCRGLLHHADLAAAARPRLVPDARRADGAGLAGRPAPRSSPTGSARAARAGSSPPGRSSWRPAPSASPQRQAARRRSPGSSPGWPAADSERDWLCPSSPTR
jgi:hypothetical protein